MEGQVRDIVISGLLATIVTLGAISGAVYLSIHGYFEEGCPENELGQPVCYIQYYDTCGKVEYWERYRYDHVDSLNVLCDGKPMDDVEADLIETEETILGIAVTLQQAVNHRPLKSTRSKQDTASLWAESMGDAEASISVPDKVNVAPHTVKQTIGYAIVDDDDIFYYRRFDQEGVGSATREPRYYRPANIDFPVNTNVIWLDREAMRILDEATGIHRILVERALVEDTGMLNTELYKSLDQSLSIDIGSNDITKEPLALIDEVEELAPTHKPLRTLLPYLRRAMFVVSPLLTIVDVAASAEPLNEGAEISTMFVALPEPPPGFPREYSEWVGDAMYWYALDLSEKGLEYSDRDWELVLQEMNDRIKFFEYLYGRHANSDEIREILFSVNHEWLLAVARKSISNSNQILLEETALHEAIESFNASYGYMTEAQENRYKFYWELEVALREEVVGRSLTEKELEAVKDYDIAFEGMFEPEIEYIDLPSTPKPKLKEVEDDPIPQVEEPWDDLGGWDEFFEDFLDSEFDVSYDDAYEDYLVWADHTSENDAFSEWEYWDDRTSDDDYLDDGWEIADDWANDDWDDDYLDDGWEIADDWANDDWGWDDDW